MVLYGLAARPVFLHRRLVLLLAMATVLLRAAIATAAPSSWSPAGPLPAALQDHVSVTLADGRVLVLGGWDRSVYFFDPATNTFSASGIHSVFAHDLGASAVRRADGRVLIVAGWATPDKAELFD